jgi:hypothetical protein
VYHSVLLPADARESAILELIARASSAHSKLHLNDFRPMLQVTFSSATLEVRNHERPPPRADQQWRSRLDHLHLRTQFNYKQSIPSAPPTIQIQRYRYIYIYIFKIALLLLTAHYNKLHTIALVITLTSDLQRRSRINSIIFFGITHLRKCVCW